MMTTHSQIDRLSATRRPEGKPCGYQAWRRLLFLHWPVPIEALRPLVPSSLELDLFDGVAYAGLVPFKMERVIPWRWWPRPLAFHFLETNVRTYVHYQGNPGVFFLTLDAVSWLAVQMAKRMWSLPYHHAKMRWSEEAGVQTYQSARRADPTAKSLVQFQSGASLGNLPEESIDFFFLERYLLFVERHGQLLQGQVHHTPYPAHGADVIDVQDSLVSHPGLTLDDPMPAYAHYSPGVDVEIFPLRPV